MKSLWQIFVPSTDNTGKEFSLMKHHEWDNKVKNIAGGLTINKRSRGVWQSPMTGKLFEEKVIPVLIYCTRKEIEKIMDITLVHYSQEEVMCFKVSNEVIIKRI